MGRLDEWWLLGWLRCTHCGYEWSAAVDTVDMAAYGEQIKKIIAGEKPFQAECPRCFKMTRINEVSGQ